MRAGRIPLLSLAILFAFAAFNPTPTLAQAVQDPAPSRERSIGAGEEFGRPKAPVAQVGAGTTSGSTTGYSGPKGEDDVASAKPSLPPLPSPALCEPYRDTPAHQGCLSVVLRRP